MDEIRIGVETTTAIEMHFLNGVFNGEEDEEDVYASSSRWTIKSVLNSPFLRLGKLPSIKKIHIHVYSYEI